MSARRLSDAQVRFLRACDRAGQVQVASLDHQERRTVRGLQTRGLVSRETSGAIRVVVLTDGGRDALAGTSRDPDPALRRIIPRGAETRATSARRVAEAERGAARSRAADAVAEWNESHPVGIQVTDRAREVMLGTTVAPALQLATGAPVVLLESEGPAPARVFYLDEVEPYARHEPNFAAAYREGLRRAEDHAPGEERARAWNEAHQPGVVVDYHPIIGEPASTRHRTRTGAQVLPSGEPVVWLEGVVGCVALDSVRPTTRPAPGERCARCRRDNSRARQISCAQCNPAGGAGVPRP